MQATNQLFITVPQSVWDILVAKYHGGPALPARSSIGPCPECEEALLQVSLTLALTLNRSMYDTPTSRSMYDTLSPSSQYPKSFHVRYPKSSNVRYPNLNTQDEERRRAEKRAIAEADTTTINNEYGYWYIIDAGWLRRWRPRP